ncbi:MULTISPECIES: 50S ribosomal protein L25/general stress protein Ctc [unclassified Solibacillus]|uniref:50S ribosomal protein L25/general stress protein Ctc n=1 Tax=unclassified Solibacillus TaxID=2637870 RepID=UPI0030FA1DE4
MTAVLKAKKRNTGKRSTLTQLRKDGQLAGVLYGYETNTTPISLDYRETAKVVQTYGTASVFKIEVDGKRVNAVLTDIQRDAIKGLVKHVDFLAINMKEELEVDVPVAFIGTSVGVKEGGVLTQPNHTLKVKVNPSDIPDTVEIDVSGLEVGDTLSVGNVRDQFTGFSIVQDDDYTLATVTPPAAPVEDVNADAENVTADDVEATGEKLTPEKPGRED